MIQDDLWQEPPELRCQFESSGQNKDGKLKRGLSYKHSLIYCSKRFNGITYWKSQQHL